MITKRDTNKEYHSNEAISASGLKIIYLQSVYHYLNYKSTESASMLFGSAVHSYFLEGEKGFKNDFYVYDKPDLRKKDNKEKHEKILEIIGDKKVITVADYEEILAIKKNFNECVLAVEYCKGITELSHYGVYNSMDVKVRPDCFDAEKKWISDIKTTRDNSPKAFKREIYSRAYHLQAAFYSAVLDFPMENFRFIAIENVYPYSVEVYALDEEEIVNGKKALEIAFDKWMDYKLTGKVTKYSTNKIAADGAYIL